MWGHTQTHSHTGTQQRMSNRIIARVIWGKRNGKYSCSIVFVVVVCCCCFASMLRRAVTCLCPIGPENFAINYLYFTRTLPSFLLSCPHNNNKLLLVLFVCLCSCCVSVCMLYSSGTGTGGVVVVGNTLCLHYIRVYIGVFTIRFVVGLNF